MTDFHIVNGSRSAVIAGTDRGLAYGDGLFETMRVIGSDIPLWPRHKRRLIKGCLLLGIELDNKRLEQDLKSILASSRSGQSIVKLIITRGGEAAGYRQNPQSEDAPHNLYLGLTALNEPASTTPVLNAQFCKHQLAKQSALAGIKHLNRLDQVLAAREIANPADEGILVDSDNQVVEAISSNLIGVKEAKLYFPNLTESGVQGIMQELVYDLAESIGLEVNTGCIGVDQFLQFDEILATNAVRGIRNICTIREHWSGTTTEIGGVLRAQLSTELSASFYSY